MENRLSVLNQIIIWGQKGQKTEDNERLLLKQLSEIVTLYFSIEDLSDDTEYSEPPKNDTSNIWKNVQINFPKFSQYNIPSDIAINLQQTELIVGDPYDDLVDIISDFMDFVWYSENTSYKNAVWYFKFGFMSHWGKHLYDLQQYLFHHIWDL